MCFMLRCVVLRCVVLWCIVLYCVVLCCVVLCCVVLCCIVLCCVVLFFVVLCCVVLCCVVLTVQRYHGFIIIIFRPVLSACGSGVRPASEKLPRWLEQLLNVAGELSMGIEKLPVGVWIGATLALILTLSSYSQSDSHSILVDSHSLLADSQ